MTKNYLPYLSKNYTDMTNEERRERRYWRRKQNRWKKKQKFLNSLPSYDEVFTFKNLLNASDLCCKGVGWKHSIQSWKLNTFVNVCDLYKRLMEGTYKSKGFNHFQIHERGKLRNISSVHISERVVQRCLCDQYLVPLLSHYIIYDNGASLKGKGTDFAINRLIAHLQKFYRRNGNDGYIITYDFKDYFASIDHQILYKNIDPLMQDERLRNLTHHFIDNFGDVGVGLGSQVSQICAVKFPTELDLAFKQRRFKYYGRYMDDGYVIVKSKEEAKLCKELLYEYCGRLNISINERKIGVHKISKSFAWLKKRFFVTDSGKVVVRLTHKNMYNYKRKMRKVKDKGLPYADALNVLKSKCGSIRKYNTYHYIQDLKTLFDKLYIKDWIKNGHHDYLFT